MRLTPQNMRLVGGCARGAEVAASASTFESSCVQSLVCARCSRRHTSYRLAYLGSTASGSGVNPSVRHGSFTYGESASGGGGRSRACAVPSWPQISVVSRQRVMLSVRAATARILQGLCRAARSARCAKEACDRRLYCFSCRSSRPQKPPSASQRALLGRASHQQRPECQNRPLEVLRFMIKKTKNIAGKLASMPSRQCAWLIMNRNTSLCRFFQT